jgi:hypothetical protein
MIASSVHLPISLGTEMAESLLQAFSVKVTERTHAKLDLSQFSQ